MGSTGRLLESVVGICALPSTVTEFAAHGSGMAFDPDKHPRQQSGSNPGQFAVVEKGTPVGNLNAGHFDPNSEHVAVESGLVDRTGWPKGPWDDEADQYVWTDPQSDYRCVIRRMPTSGHLCGYVGIPDNLDRPRLDSNQRLAIDVHNGVTYAGSDPLTDDDDDYELFYFGFDCAHESDTVPNPLMKNDLKDPARYRDVSYVAEDVERLCRHFEA